MSDTATDRGEWGGPGPEERPPTATLVTLAEVDPTPPDPVLWSARFGPGSPLLSVGEVAVFSGPGGMGKSTVALAVAVAAGATGDHGESCGLAVRPGPVVFASFEDSGKRMAARLRWFADGVGADGKPVARHVLAWDRPRPLWTVNPDTGEAPQSPEWPAFWRAVREAGATLVVIDPVSVALAGVSVSDSGTVRDFLDSVTREAEAAGCGVLLVAHDTKAARNAARAGEDPGAGAVAGSGGWFDGARGVLYLWREQGADTLILEAIKSNYGPTGWGARLKPRNGGDPWRGYELAKNGGLTRQQVDAARKPRKSENRTNPKSGNGAAGDSELDRLNQALGNTP